MMFVTHDLGVIADIADGVVVMYAGQIVEETDAAALFTRPRHPYTEALLDSIPQLAPAGGPLHDIPGMVPRPGQIPEGCRFHPRCSYATDACVAAPVKLAPPRHPDPTRAVPHRPPDRRPSPEGGPGPLAAASARRS